MLRKESPLLGIEQMGTRPQRVTILHRTEYKSDTLMGLQSLHSSTHLLRREVASYGTQRLQGKVGNIPILRLGKPLQMRLGIGYQEVVADVYTDELQIAIRRDKHRRIGYSHTRTSHQLHQHRHFVKRQSRVEAQDILHRPVGSCRDECRHSIEASFAVLLLHIQLGILDNRRCVGQGR